jgi:hypothetical protein
MTSINAMSGPDRHMDRVFEWGVFMLVDINALAEAQTRPEPYPHAVIPGFLPAVTQAEVTRDFPSLDIGGLFLPDAAPMGPSMRAIIDTLEGPVVRGLIGDKLGLDLRGRPTLVTLRSRCQARDGRIHADSKFKVATMLLYVNGPWMEDGGRLRILNSGENIEDHAGEVAPDFGTLVFFKVQNNSWHGHKPFIGPRRYIMVNYCWDEAVRNSEASRHRMSTRFKKVRRALTGEAA